MQTARATPTGAVAGLGDDHAICRLHEPIGRHRSIVAFVGQRWQIGRVDFPQRLVVRARRSHLELLIGSRLHDDRPAVPCDSVESRLGDAKLLRVAARRIDQRLQMHRALHVPREDEGPMPLAVSGFRDRLIGDGNLAVVV